MTIEESTSATNRKRGRPPGSCNATRAAKRGVSEVANFVWDTDHQRLKTFLRIRLVELASKFINSRDNNALRVLLYGVVRVLSYGFQKVTYITKIKLYL